MFLSSSLSQKIMTLDILNWVAALETADPNERTSTDCHQKNDYSTDATTRSLSQCQTLTYLLCFFDTVDSALSKGAGENCSTNLENPDKTNELYFDLENFLVNCFLKSGRDIGTRALRFVFNTVLTTYVQGTDRFENASGREVLYKAVINSLKRTTKTNAKSIYGIYCLYRILYVLLKKELGKSESRIEFKNTTMKLQECTELLVELSSLMERHIHPYSVILRSKYGLYTSPFDIAVMASDLEYLKNKSKLKSKHIPDYGKVPRANSYEQYFSEEEVDLCVFMTPQKLGRRKALAACGFSDGYYNTHIACVECQPLHFKCIHTSEGCTFGSGAETTDDWGFLNGYLPETTGNIHKDYQQSYAAPFAENTKPDSSYIEDLLSVYAGVSKEAIGVNSKENQEHAAEKLYMDNVCWVIEETKATPPKPSSWYHFIVLLFTLWLIPIGVVAADGDLHGDMAELARRSPTLLN